MSYNHPYRNQPDDYGASNDKYKDSQRLYHRESTAYRSRIQSRSPEQTSPSSSEPVLSSVKALSFLHSCGLDAEDLQTLAELPEHLIATDTLPDLLAQIKKKKASGTSSSRSTVLQASSSSHSWDDRGHTQLVEYPLDMPVRQSYSLPREQLPTWDDHWENVQQANSPACTYTSSDSNYVVEYNHLKDKEPYFDKSSYATEPSRQKTSAVSQSYSSYSRDVGQSSHLSSRDDSHSSHLSNRDSASQPSHRSSRDVGQSSHLSSRDVSQSSYLSSRDVSQSSHRSSRDISHSSHLSSRDIGQSSHLSTRDVSLQPLLSSRDTVPPSLLSSRNIAPPSLLSSRDVGSSSLLSGREGGLPSLLSIRDLAPTSHLSSRDIGQSSHHRRTESAPRVPTRKEASDFHGKTPPVFPYACVLCDITVLSNKDWSVHIKGAQHANSQLSLVEKYPAWDQTIQSARRNDPQPVRPTSRTTQKRGGKSNSRNGSSASRSGASNSKSQSSSNQKRNNTEANKCKVVCVKFEVDEVNEAYLKKLLGQFGAISKIIMLPRMAFVNMGTASQAEDIVKYFYQNPLRIRGELIVFTLSAAFSFLQTSRVVSFSPLPSGDGIRSELTAVAKRFGAVKNSLFLPTRGYVEMSSAEEADKLVKHYSTNSLKIKGKTINVCSSTEYQTLGTKDADKEKSPVPYSSSSSRRRRRSCSPRRRSHRDSPSPKRRASEERSRSRKSQDSKKREESRRSREKTKESSRRDSSSKSRSKKSSPSKDQKSKTTTEESVEEKVEDDNDQSDIMADDSDLEGVAVIADDGEALNSEDELTVDDEMDDEAHDTSEEQEQDASEDAQAMKESDDQTTPLDMDTSSVKPETSECVPTATTSDRSGDCKEAKELQQGEQKEPQEMQKEPKEEPKELKEEPKELKKETKKLTEELQQAEQKELEKKQKALKKDQEELKQEEQKDDTVAMEEEAADFSENLDKEEGDEMEISTSITEEKFGKVLEVAGFPVAKKYSEADLMKIGKKYGDVAGCCLVRNNRKVEKALIEMVNAADAAKLEAECKRQHIKLGGRNLRITVSKIYSQLNEGQSVDTDSEKEKVKQDIEETNKEPPSTLASSEERTVVMAETEISEEDAEVQEAKETNMDTIMQMSSDEEGSYGRVLRIRNLPMPDEYTDAEFLNIAEPYGKVVRHWMLRVQRTGLIEMKSPADAEKVVAAANMNKITVAGKHPKILVSTKHAHLNKWYFLHGPRDGSIPPPIDLEEDDDDESKIENSISEQQTSANVKESSNDNQVDNSKADEKQDSAADDESGTKAENSDVVSETPTPVLDPAGTEFVRPVVGYFCNLCNAIYASEEEAKNEHCRTPMHHQKLKEHKERNGST
ncbi:matrin 3-like 1.1 [Labeo rohita]|uniref:matrin 3-like 1.1 n=1 Tax=Labeo rohita TaxID=84645 RepID=UPI0021E1DD7B|nr:matrin 3-like 1.1 [Labeo rohita]XP_050983623.1 matrin 3-like 1.1 [Labeo rohita]